MSKKINTRKLRNRLQVKRKDESLIEEYSKKRLREFLKEDQIDIQMLRKARKLLT